MLFDLNCNFEWHLQILMRSINLFDANKAEAYQRVTIIKLIIFIKALATHLACLTWKIGLA